MPPSLGQAVGSNLPGHPGGQRPPAHWEVVTGMRSPRGAPGRSSRDSRPVAGAADTSLEQCSSGVGAGLSPTHPPPLLQEGDEVYRAVGQGCSQHCVRGAGAEQREGHAVLQSLHLPAAPRCSQHQVNGPGSPFQMGGASGTSQAGPPPLRPPQSHPQTAVLPQAGPGAGHCRRGQAPLATSGPARALKEVGTVLPLRLQDQ